MKIQVNHSNGIAVIRARAHARAPAIPWHRGELAGRFDCVMTTLTTCDGVKAVSYEPAIATFRVDFGDAATGNANWRKLEPAIRSVIGD